MSTAPAPLEHRVRLNRRVVLALMLALSLVGITAVITYALVDGSSESTTAIQGSGVPTSEKRAVSGFTTVELAGSNNVTIRVGERLGVRVYGDDNLVDRITTDVVGDSLIIGNLPGSFTTRSPTGVEVSVPSLDAFTLSGSGIANLTGVDQSLLTVTVSGSGVIRASGATDQLEATVSGSGEAQLDQLVALAVRAVVSGSGLIAVTATESLDGSVPGSGAILYRGNPSDVTTSITGSGSIVPS